MGMMDKVRSAIGLTDGRKAEEAAAMRSEMTASRDPADIYARSIADKVSDHGLDAAMRAMPEIATTGAKWPRSADERWMQVAEAARGTAQRMRGTPMAGVDGRIANVATDRALVDAAASYDGRRPAREHLETTRADVGNAVRNVIGTGAAATQMAHRTAMELEGKGDPAMERRMAMRTAEHVQDRDDAHEGGRRGRLFKTAHAYLAMARVGLVPPGEIVEHAMATRTPGSTSKASTRPIDWEKAARAESPTQRQGLVFGETERNDAQAEADYARLRPKEQSHARRPQSMGEVMARGLDGPVRSAGRGLGEGVVGTTVFNDPKNPEARTRAQGVADMLASAAEPQSVLIAGHRFTGETVGQRAQRELDEAVKGRQRMGDDWRAPKDSMIRPMFLQGDITELKKAQAGRTAEMRDASFQGDMESYARVANKAHIERVPTQPAVRAQAMGAMMAASSQRG